MEYRVIKINELDKANELYRYVIKFCKTWDWNENYPSLKMIEEDIVTTKFSFFIKPTEPT